MKLVTFSKTMELTLATIEAGAPVVVSDGAALALEQAVNKTGGHMTASGLGHYTRRYCGQDLAGKRLLVWRGHGIGDQLMAAGLAALIARYRPGGEILYLGHPLTGHTLWHSVAGLPFTPVAEPLPFAEWLACDYHLILEDMCEADRQPDQPNTWRATVWAAGLDGVPDREMLPFIALTDADRERWAAAVRATPELAGPLRAGRPLVVWGLAASSRIRSLAPAETRAAIEAVSALPSRPVVAAIGLAEQVEEHTSQAGRAPGVAYLNLPCRAVFAAVEQAACTVSADSMLGHAAAGLGRPCVSLWSSFHPEDRVATYPTHRPIYQPLSCSPCRLHEGVVGHSGCPLFPGEYCRGLRAIPPARIARAVAEVIRP
jgi:ADP-heptose:LPS heptosyltransferase